MTGVKRSYIMFVYELFREAIMKIKLFSDMVCPYCYVGKLRLDQAIEKLGLTDAEVEFKAFQLHPLHSLLHF